MKSTRMRTVIDHWQLSMRDEKEIIAKMQRENTRRYISRHSKNKETYLQEIILRNNDARIHS